MKYLILIHEYKIINEYYDINPNLIINVYYKILSNNFEICTGLLRMVFRERKKVEDVFTKIFVRWVGREQNSY